MTEVQANGALRRSVGGVDLAPARVSPGVYRLNSTTDLSRCIATTVATSSERRTISHSLSTDGSGSMVVNSWNPFDGLPADASFTVLIVCQPT